MLHCFAGRSLFRLRDLFSYASDLLVRFFVLDLLESVLVQTREAVKQDLRLGGVFLLFQLLVELLEGANSSDARVVCLRLLALHLKPRIPDPEVDL